MDRLEQIKNEVAREYDFDSWDDCFDTMATAEFSHPGMFDYDKIINEVVRRYATEMVRHDRERVANNATIETYEYNDYGQRINVLDLGQEVNQNYIDYYAVNKKSITSLEIELI